MLDYCKSSGFLVLRKRLLPVGNEPEMIDMTRQSKVSQFMYGMVHLSGTQSSYFRFNLLSLSRFFLLLSSSVVTTPRYHILANQRTIINRYDIVTSINKSSSRKRACSMFRTAFFPFPTTEGQLCLGYRYFHGLAACYGTSLGILAPRSIPISTPIQMALVRIVSLQLSVVK